MSEFRIRQMYPADLQHVGPLYMEMVREQIAKGQSYPDLANDDETQENFTFGILRGLKTPGSGLGGFVAVDGNVAKGFALSVIANRWIGQPKVYCLGETLYVSPGFRHRGLGNLLVRAMSEWGIANGAGALEVVYKPGSEAHKQWARMGFRSYTVGAVLAGADWKPVLDYPEFKASSVINKDEIQQTAIGE